MLDSVINKMNLSESERQFIIDNYSDEIKSKIKSIWQVVEDASEYAFNASHSYAVTLDSLYTAYVKAHFPLEFYEEVLQMFSEKKKTDKVSLLKNEALKSNGIIVQPMLFGQNNTRFTANKDTNEIYQDLMAIKSINKIVSEKLLELRSNKYDNFLDLYLDMKNKKLSKTHIKNLAKIGYFVKIEPNKNKSVWLCDNFDDFNKVQFKKDNIDTLVDLGVSDNIKSLYDDLVSISVKSTPRLLTFKKYDLIRFIYNSITIPEVDELNKLYWECSLLGTPIEEIDKDCLLGRVIKYNSSTNKMLFKHINTGVEQWMKIDCSVHVKEQDYIFIYSMMEKKYKNRVYYTCTDLINLNEKYS